METLQLPDSMEPIQALKELTIKAIWNLSTSHPRVSSEFVALGSAHFLLATCRSSTANSMQQQTAAAHLLQVSLNPSLVVFLPDADDLSGQNPLHPAPEVFQIT